MKKMICNKFVFLVLILCFQMFFCLAAENGKVISANNIPTKALELKQRGNSKSGFDAIAIYKEALKIYPEYDTVFLNIGVEWSGLGYKRTAVEFYSKAIEINPKFNVAYYYRAYVKYRIFNDTIGAIEDYYKAIEADADSSFVRPYNNLSVIYQEMGDSINELAIMRRGIEVCRKQPDEIFYYNYANTLYNAGLYWRALDICNEGFSHFPKSGDIQYMRARTYSAVGDLVNALWDYSSAAELGNEDAIKMMNKVKGE